MTTLNLYSLPVVRIANKRELPLSAGVYFVMTATRDLLYVGSAVSLRKRWRVNHHRKSDIENAQGCLIGWMEALPDEIQALECQMIQDLKPPLNVGNGNPTGTVKLRMVGGSLVLTLPQSIVKPMGLAAGNNVSLTATAREIIIRPALKKLKQ